MIKRPELPRMQAVDTVDAVLAWLDHAVRSLIDARRVDQRCASRPRDHAGLRAADDHERRHVGAGRISLRNRRQVARARPIGRPRDRRSPASCPADARAAVQTPGRVARDARATPDCRVR